MTDKSPSNSLLEFTTEIVAAHVSNNSVAPTDLPQLIDQVYQSLANIGKGPAGAGERPKPAVNVKRSVHPDYIVCLEDGKKLKMLKRHLKTAYNMTPEAYRQRYRSRHTRAPGESRLTAAGARRGGTRYRLAA